MISPVHGDLVFFDYRVRVFDASMRMVTFPYLGWHYSAVALPPVAAVYGGVILKKTNKTMNDPAFVDYCFVYAFPSSFCDLLSYRQRVSLEMSSLKKVTKVMIGHLDVLLQR